MIIIKYAFKIFRRVKSEFIEILIKKLPYFSFIHEIQNPTQPITFEHWYDQKILRINNNVTWPVHRSSRIIYSQNISCGKGSSPGYMPNSYIQGLGKIIIGKYSIFAPNIGIISANHDLHDNSKHIYGVIKIGDYCWIGMGAIILPNVELGDYTIVAAGSVVTKSFPQGYCVIGGSPAKIIKNLNKEDCVRYEYESSYVGYKKIV